MKIKTPPVNVDDTQTKVDGGIDLSFDSNVQSSVNVPMVKLRVDVPQIWLRLTMKKQGTNHWRLTGVITPKIQGVDTADIVEDNEHVYGKPINVSTQIDQSQLLNVLLNAVLKGIGEGKLKD